LHYDRREKRAMKYYITADIEGVTGVTHLDETEMGKTGYNEAREQMTAEVAAACEGLLEAGAGEIWVKDAHGDGRNIIASKLPEQVRLIRGWSGHPFFMVQEIDRCFRAVVMIGYHSRAGSNTNPLAHTQSGLLDYIKVNGRYASEFLLHAYAAALADVPVVFIAGDEGLCAEAVSINPNITTVPVMRGVGDSTVSLQPGLAVRRIREGIAASVRGDISSCRVALPERFKVELRYKNHVKAYRASFYPGVTGEEAHVVSFESSDYFEVLRTLMFIV